MEFFIVNSNTSAILGLIASQKLNLIKRIESVYIQNEYTEVINKYQDVFSGIGCISQKCSISLEANAKPVVNPIRRVAFPLLEPLKQSLEELKREKIIEKVEGPSDWVNALVLVRKPNGKLRICLDPKDLNNVIKREYCRIPTFEEVSSKLAGATIFSTLDATSGFYQIPLDDESSKLCTFGTPYGRYKFLRLPYGIKCAPEIFQERFKSIFDKIEGSDIYIDDLIIWGRNKQEHDLRLKKVLDTARENNVKFNLNKCKFGQKEIKYMGHIINNKGISPDNSKIKAISEMPCPKNKQDIQRLLGMLTYVSRFIKNFSDKTEPLRSLLKKENEFIWDEDKEKAFVDLKETLTTNPVLQFFDINKQSVISVDSSKSGVGACLLQNNLPCAYASKALTDTQTRYAQIEKELYAVCFGLTKFYQYIFGRRVIVETDHQPLISIFKKPLNKCPARLQRMLLQLQKFDFELRYKPGKDLLLADALSRAYLVEKEVDLLDDDIEGHVCMVKLELNATPEKINEFVIETNKDTVLNDLKELIKNGWPNSNKKVKNQVKIFCPYKSELTVIDGLIFRNNCLVVPKSLQKEMLDRIHYSHLGVNKCIKLAQDSLFWPGMVDQIRQKISNCHQCLTYANSQNKEPLKPHEIPALPWNKIGCDIFEIKGKKYLLVIDYFSKYVEVAELLNNPTSHMVITNLKSIFARHGIPVTFVSDGGPQFTSQEFKTFSRQWEFKHIVSSPTYAQSNGMAERHIQTIKKMFKKIFNEKKDLYMALLHYRTTPIFENISPSEILMSRKLRTNLIITKNQSKPRIAKEYNKTIIKEKQELQQKYYNKNATKNLPELYTNQSVYVQTKPNGNWFLGKVVSKLRDRTYRLQMNNGSMLIRNRKFIKPVGNKHFLNNSENHYSSAKEENHNEIKYFIELKDDDNISNDKESVREERVVVDFENRLENEQCETTEDDNHNEESVNDGDSESNSDASSVYEESITIVVDENKMRDSSESDSDLEAKFIKKTCITSSGRISRPPPKRNQF